jgi:hypothetical protein
MKLKKVVYSQLKARQKENFNFQKISAILADYGFTTMRLSDDWEGADFIARHIEGDVIHVQLKSRLTFDKKYKAKNLYIAFGHDTAWYLYPHDELLGTILRKTTIGRTSSWNDKGGYSFSRLSKRLKDLLAPYRIGGDTKPVPM